VVRKAHLNDNPVANRTALLVPLCTHLRCIELASFGHSPMRQMSEQLLLVASNLSVFNVHDIVACSLLTTLILRKRCGICNMLISSTTLLSVVYGGDTTRADDNTPCLWFMVVTPLVQFDLHRSVHLGHDQRRGQQRGH
jgi:hypothetical protein